MTIATERKEEPDSALSEPEEEQENLEPVDLPGTPYPVDTTTEAVRQGHTGDGVRYILAISTLLAALALFAILFFML